MRIIITPELAQYGIPAGEYELATHPIYPELQRFRKAAGYTPSELDDALKSGTDILRLYTYTALLRSDQHASAANVFNLPLDVLGEIDADLEDGDEPVEGDELPPTLRSESPESDSSE
jgi:hypothetical protein